MARHPLAGKLEVRSEGSELSVTLVTLTKRTPLAVCYPGPIRKLAETNGYEICPMDSQARARMMVYANAA